MNEAILLENRTYWSHRAPSYSEVNREELATHQHAVWKQVLTEQISARFPGRTPDQIHILEIGTGPGFFAILLAEVGYRVTAIDLTPSMLEEARSNAGKLCDCINFREMNAEKLSFDDACFDVILSRNVTWNLSEPEKAYAEWVRVLKPGGLLMTFDANGMPICLTTRRVLPMSATEETALRNEIKMQNERIGVDSEVLNIEATWGGSIMEGRG